MSIKSLFENIANAIKNVYGTTDTLTPAEMPEAITNFNSIFQTKNLSAPISGQTTVEGCLSSLSSDLSELKPSTLPTSYTTRASTSNQVDHFHGCSFNVVIPAFMQSSRCTLTLTQANGITDSTATDIKSNVYFRDNNNWVQTTINGLSFAENGSRCLLANNTVCGAVELTFSVSWS